MELTAYQKAELWGRIEATSVRLREAAKQQGFAVFRETYTRLGELIARMEEAKPITD
jgi:predicted acyltransferase (DUF342 family)